MYRNSLLPGAAVVARQALGYGTKASEPIRYVEPGTKGRILRIQDEKNWTLVEVLFDGHDHIYACSLECAVFGLRPAEV